MVYVPGSLYYIRVESYAEYPEGHDLQKHPGGKDLETDAEAAPCNDIRKHGDWNYIREPPAAMRSEVKSPS